MIYKGESRSFIAAQNLYSTCTVANNPAFVRQEKGGTRCFSEQLDAAFSETAPAGHHPAFIENGLAFFARRLPRLRHPHSPEITLQARTAFGSMLLMLSVVVVPVCAQPR
jgi:hypothetical protein